MTIKDIMKKAISDALHEIQSDEQNFVVETPTDETKGDYACNAAMLVAKKLSKNPRVVAEELVLNLKKDRELNLVIDVNRLEVAGPGFINFWIRDEYLKVFMSGQDINIEKSMKGKRVLVEYSSPNIAKRFSVGHLRSTIIGNALEKLYKSLGADVTNDNHLGDWGTQFGMIIAVVEEKGLDVTKMSVEELEKEYVEFNARIKIDPILKDKAREAFARLEAGDESARQIWRMAVDVSKTEFETIYSQLGVSFDHEMGESEYEKDMPGVIAEAQARGIAERGDRDAWIVKFEKDGKEYMPPAMLVKSDGTTTYFTRDLATIWRRLNDPDLKRDLYIYEVGSEQTLHLKQVFETVEKLGWATKDRFVHVAHGMMTVGGEKMSTRKGNNIKVDELLEKAEDKYWQMIEQKHNFRFENTDAVATGAKPSEVIKMHNSLPIGSIKYNELRRSPSANYEFRWEEALSMEGNSAPYINYAYVRARKIVGNKDVGGFEGYFEGEERELARFLMKYGEGEILEQAARNFAPQVVCGYLFELARRFNAFYDHNRVLGDPREVPRLTLVNMVAAILKSGMSNLGITLVESM